MTKPNFHYEQRRLENELVALEIFNPDIHAATFVETINSSPDILKYIPLTHIKTEEEFRRSLYDILEPSPADCLYAIIDKVSGGEGSEQNGTFAGVVSLNGTNPTNATTEIGVIIFPNFQRTHVASNAIGLMLQYLLDAPAAGGLGLRRVEWRCNAENEASRRIARRMGFELEGILRWQQALPDGMVGQSVEGLEKKNGTTGELRGRHTAIFSIVWDEWDKKRASITTQMVRRS